MSKSKLSKYFKFPLEHSNHGNFITDQNGHKFVDMLTYNYKIQDIVDCLNGVKKCTKDYDIVVISRGGHHSQKECRIIANLVGEILEQEMPNVFGIVDWRKGMLCNYDK